MKLKGQEADERKGRHNPFVIIAAVVFLLLLGRLWYLQVIQGQQFRLLSENNRIRLRTIPAVRGMILDRHGRVMADNRPSFDLRLMPEDAGDVPNVVRNLTNLLGLSAQEVFGRIKSKARCAFQPVTLKRDIVWNELSLIKTYRLDLPGVELDIAPRRAYPFGQSASHVLGYVGEIDKGELRKSRDYQLGDWVGKSGVEIVCESFLRGMNGGRQVEVDALGRELRVLDEVVPTPGYSVYLTLDLDVQQCAERLLEGKAGVIIAMDPRNGELIAFASSPPFSPEAFASGISPQQWEALLSNPRHPLQNRGLQGLYPPGSVFKIVTAAAGLEEGVITKDTPLYCPGIFFLGNMSYRCWKDEGHGNVALHRALVESCDVFFYQVAQRVGVEKLSAYAKAFGLGRPTGIELEGEKSGIVPNAEWKRRVLGHSWYPGETISMGIGQGYVLVTPLQMVNLVSALANGGVFYKPLVIKRIKSVDESVRVDYRPQERGGLSISTKTQKLLRQALRGVINEDHGTGWACRIPGVQVAGKTGTAQVTKLGEGRRLKPEEMPYAYRDHAWFVAFAPVESPRVAVAVMVEHGGHGGSAAAPLAKEVIRTCLSKGEGAINDR